MHALPCRVHAALCACARCCSAAALPRSIRQLVSPGTPCLLPRDASLLRHAAPAAQLLPPHLAGASVELLPYLVDSFGNATRIDYGTGHETNFAAFLYCLAALGLVQEADRAALVCVVFNR